MDGKLILPMKLFKDKRVTKSLRLVYTALVFHKSKGNDHPSIREISEVSGITSPNTICQAVADLTAYGWIECHKTTGKNTVYTLMNGGDNNED